MSDIEQQIQDKGLNAPRLTPEDIKNTVHEIGYTVLEGTTTTICYLTLRNGFVVTGESACASPENFDVQIGQQIAYNNALDKVWMLEGYLLKQKLWEQQHAS